MLGEVIQERTTSDVAGPDGPEPDEGAAIPSSRAQLRRISSRLRPLALVVVAALALVLLYQPVVGGLVASNRQRHLSSDFATPKPLVHRGEAVAVIQIPRLGVNRIVVLGDGIDELRGAPGVPVGGLLPGQPGVSVIVGHRSAYGAPFERIDELVAGDVIAVQTRNLRAVEYRVTTVGTATDGSIDGSKVGLSDGSGATSGLVLATGSGSWFADDAIVVTATASIPGVAPETPTTIDVTPPGAPLVSTVTWLALVAALGGVLALASMRSSRWHRAAWCLVPVGGLVWVLAMMSLEPALASLR